MNAETNKTSIILTILGAAVQGLALVPPNSPDAVTLIQIVSLSVRLYAKEPTGQTAELPNNLIQASPAPV